MEEKTLSHEESLKLIHQMIGKAKDNIYETGFSAILWGTVIFICAIVTWLQIQYDFKPPFNIWWLVAVAVIVNVLYEVLMDKRPKNIVKTHEETAMSWIWSVFGFGIGVMVFIQAVMFSQYDAWIQAAGITGDQKFKLYEYACAFWLLWYGFPGIITGGLIRFYLMLAGSLLCWVLAVITLFTPVNVDYLLLAAGALAAWLIPGIFLRRRYLKRKRSHV